MGSRRRHQKPDRRPSVIRLPAGERRAELISQALPREQKELELAIVESFLRSISAPNSCRSAYPEDEPADVVVAPDGGEPQIGVQVTELGRWKDEEMRRRATNLAQQIKRMVDGDESPGISAAIYVSGRADAPADYARTLPQAEDMATALRAIRQDAGIDACKTHVLHVAGFSATIQLEEQPGPTNISIEPQIWASDAVRQSALIEAVQRKIDRCYDRSNHGEFWLLVYGIDTYFFHEARQVTWPVYEKVRDGARGAVFNRIYYHAPIVGHPQGNTIELYPRARLLAPQIAPR